MDTGSIKSIVSNSTLRTPCSFFFVFSTSLAGTVTAADSIFAPEAGVTMAIFPTGLVRLIFASCIKAIFPGQEKNFADYKINPYLA